jgi:hypothetical protein
MVDRERGLFFYGRKDKNVPIVKITPDKAEIAPSDDRIRVEKLMYEALPDLRIGKFIPKPLNRRRR